MRENRVRDVTTRRTEERMGGVKKRRRGRKREREMEREEDAGD